MKSVSKAALCCLKLPLLGVKRLENPLTCCSLLTYITQHVLLEFSFSVTHIFDSKDFQQRDELNKQAQSLTQENNLPTLAIWCCNTSCVILYRLMIDSSTSCCFGFLDKFWGHFRSNLSFSITVSFIKVKVFFPLPKYNEYIANVQFGTFVRLAGSQEVVF